MSKIVNENLRQTIFVKRIELLFQQFVVGFVSALATAIITVIVLWNAVPIQTLIIWFATISIILLLRFVLVYTSKKNVVQADYEYWNDRYIVFLVTALIQGIIWGLLGTLLFPEENDSYRAFVIVVLAGMSAGALPLMFHVKEVFIAFVVPMLLPFAIHMFMVGGKAYIAIGFLTLFYFTGMLLIAIKREQSLIETIKLRFENEALIDDMRKFNYALSHDLKSPLRSINGFAELLAEEVENEDNENIHFYLQKIQENGRRMDRLIEELLKLYRLTNEELSVSRVNLSNLANEYITDLKKSDPGRHVVVNIEENLIVKGDENLLRVVVENLLENSWKYTGKTDHPKIEFMHHNRNTFCVRDNGVGFNMKYADKLFHSFSRLHTYEDFPGTGIGLASVSRIVERHNGRIWANAEEGKGAAFYFSLKM